MKLNPTHTSIVKRLLSGRNSRPLRSILLKTEPADLASLLGQFNSRERRLLLEALIDVDKATATLLELPDTQIASTLRTLSHERMIQLFLSSTNESVAYLISQMSETEREVILNELGAEKNSKIRQLLSYPEDSAGRLMETDAFALPIQITAGQGLEVIRKAAGEQSIYYIYCTDKSGKLQGVLSLRDLATANPETPLQDLIKKDVVSVTPDASSEEAARIVSHYDFIALPVVDSNRVLLGVITVDDVLDIIQEQATANIYAQVGLQENDRVYSSMGFKIKNRMPWMFLNLLLGALASSVVSLFEDTMSQLIVLASLKNIVAGMGGNTAIQTLTVVTRGIATGDFSFITHGKTIVKETIVGVVIGSMTGLAAALLIYFWKGSTLVSVVIFISMILNSLVAACFGAFVPILLDKFKWDPATGSGVIVTMITDIFGFFSFLGIATLGLKLLNG